MQLPPRCEFVMNWNSDISSTLVFITANFLPPPLPLSLFQLWQLQKYFMCKFGWDWVQENVLISSQIRHMVRLFEFQCECTLIWRDFENVIFVSFVFFAITDYLQVISSVNSGTFVYTLLLLVVTSTLIVTNCTIIVLSVRCEVLEELIVIQIIIWSLLRLGKDWQWANRLHRGQIGKDLT